MDSELTVDVGKLFVVCLYIVCKFC